MEDVKRKENPLTDNERRMIISTHQYFFQARQGMEQPQHSRLRKQVATVLGVGEATVERVVADWKQRNDGKFTPHQTIGRPKLEPNPNIIELIRILVNASNLTVAGQE
jgi:transposase